MLQSLVSALVVVEEGPIAAALPPDAELDLQWVAPSSEKRRLEFATGRSMAHRALKRLGVEPGTLAPDAHGAPRWPVGVVGSITHSGGWCGVAVAHQAQVRAIGVDAELVRALPGETWFDLILNPREREAIRDLLPSDLARRAVLAFSAKESLYKCQFPVTGTRLDFHDAELIAVDEAGGFELEVAVPLAGFPGRLTGRYAWRENLVMTAIELPAGG